MSNETKQNDEDTRLIDLVSYLDGELPNDQAEEIERQLISDPILRSDADILSRTWAMLDSLDEVSGSRQFTESTLKCVAAESQSLPVAQRVRSFQLLKVLARYHVLPLFLMGVAFAAAGLMAASWTESNAVVTDEQAIDRLVLQEFDMLKNLELYQRVPDAETLQQLELPSDKRPQKAGGDPTVEESAENR